MKSEQRKKKKKRSERAQNEWGSVKWRPREQKKYKKYRARETKKEWEKKAEKWENELMCAF